MVEVRLPVSLCLLALVPVLAQQADKDAAPKWDVATPLGPTRPISFETSEGTWVNVDVSPDGKTVVFDRGRQPSAHTAELPVAA